MFLGSVISLPPRELTPQTFRSLMLQLARAERDNPWLSGDLLNAAASLGPERGRIVTAQSWKDAGGYSYGTLRNRGSVCSRFPERHQVPMI